MTDIAGSGLRFRFASLAGTVGESFFVLPLIVLLGVFLLVPTATAVFRSFFDWNPGGASVFVGFDNYAELARSSTFHEILRNQGIFLLGVPVWTLLPLVVALLLFERVPAAGVFRTILFFPSLLSPVIIGILFRGVLEPDGMLNSTLSALGLGFLANDWIDSAALVKPVLIGVLAWAGLGTGVVIFSAALSALPPDLLEAAEIDGASWWQRLRYVVMPSLRPTIEFWIFVQIVGVFLGLFAWIYVLTLGGPGYASTTLDYDIYQNSISYGRFGIGAAESVYLLLMVALIVATAVFWVWIRNRREVR